MKRQKKTVMFAVLMIMLAAAACGTAGASQEAGTTAAQTAEPKTEESRAEQPIGGDPATWGPEETTAEMTGMPNPFVDCATMEEAEKLAGFDLTVPDFDFAVRETDSTELLIQAMENRLVQVFYRNGGSELMIRKAAGSGDVSGDYTDYSERHVVTVDGREVTMKGDNGEISTSVWEENGYAYAVVSSRPLAADTLTGLISGIR